MKKHIFSLLAVVLLIFSGCTQTGNEQATAKQEAMEQEATISIVLNENSTILIDDQAVNATDFSRVLENHVNELIGNGISIDKIVVNLRVAKKVKMGVVNDLQGELRQLNIRKLVYSTI